MRLSAILVKEYILQPGIISDREILQKNIADKLDFYVT